MKNSKKSYFTLARTNNNISIEIFKKFRPCFILAIHPEPIAKKGDKLEDIYDLLVELNYIIKYNNQLISKETFCTNKELIDLHLIPIKL